jgi:hypothetical protein
MKSILIIGVVAVAIVSVLLMSSIGILSIAPSQEMTEASITVDAKTYLPTSMVNFTLRIYITNMTAGTITDETHPFDYTVESYAMSSGSWKIVKHGIAQSSPVAFSVLASTLIPITGTNDMVSVNIRATTLQQVNTAHPYPSRIDANPIAFSVVKQPDDLIVDTTPPTVTSLFPSGGETVLNTQVRPVVVFDESIAPSTLTTSSFYIEQFEHKDHTPISVIIPCSIRVVSRGATLTPTSALEVGGAFRTHVTTAVTDTAGNHLTSKSTAFFKTKGEMNPPIIAITSPLFGTNNSFTTTNIVLTIIGTADDETGVFTVGYVNSANGDSAPEAYRNDAGVTGQINWEASGVSLNIGSNPLIFTATDMNGNIATKTVTVIRTAVPTINDFPTITLTSPSGNPTVSIGSIELSGTWTDTDDATTITWHNELTGKDGTCSVHAEYGKPSTWSAVIPLEQGMQSITVTIKDAASQSNSVSLKVTYVPTGDGSGAGTTASSTWLYDVAIFAGLILIGAGILMFFLTPRPIKTIGAIMAVAGVALVVVWVFLTSITPIG